MKKMSLSTPVEQYADPAIRAAKYGLLPEWSPVWRDLTPREFVEESPDSRTRARNDVPAGANLTGARGNGRPITNNTADNGCYR